MVTKGVASVPSPVRNLRETTPTVDHARFVEAVAEQFAAQYGLGREVKVRLRGGRAARGVKATDERRFVPGERSGSTRESSRATATCEEWSTSSRCVCWAFLLPELQRSSSWLMQRAATSRGTGSSARRQSSRTT